MKITWFISGRCYLFIPGSKKIINDLWKISSVFSLLFLACNFSLFLRPQFFSRFFRYANLNWHWKLHRWNWLAEEFEFWYLNRPLHKANVSFCSYYSVWVKHKKFVSYNRIEKLNFKSSLIDFTFVVLLSSILEKNNPSLFRTCFFYGVFLRPELLKCHEQWFSPKISNCVWLLPFNYNMMKKLKTQAHFFKNASFKNTHEFIHIPSNIQLRKS